MEQQNHQTQSTLYTEGYVFRLELLNGANNLLIVVEHEATQQIFHKSIGRNEVSGITKGLCETPEHLKVSLELALKRLEKWTLSIRSENVEASSSSEVVLNVLKLSISVELMPGRTIAFTLVLEQKSLAIDERFNNLVRKLGYLAVQTGDRLEIKDDNLDFFHGGLAVVKARGGNTHDSASTGVSYSTGKHYLECRIIRCTNNYCMLGVQEDVTTLTPYPGHPSHASGKALYGNGSVYYDGTAAAYGLGGFGPGDYVGILLDMDAKTVSWLINGRAGEAKPLTGKSYYFIVNIYSVGDAVEILPKYSYHRS